MTFSHFYCVILKNFLTVILSEAKNLSGTIDLFKRSLAYARDDNRILLMVFTILSLYVG